MGRVLVTGGCGFIGSHLAGELFEEGCFVRIVDVESSSYVLKEHSSEKLKLDLRVFESCLSATKGIDVVYNLAANMGGIGFITKVGAEIMY
ncbi:NAD-dependent epimerase/dehydratase family protein, partial [Candidatus Bathyarchaeota archaeon]|nr:NAD-dependent epimerase/dehydratase family protein [Candidatus Bathyarchaeota archaeon]